MHQCIRHQPDNQKVSGIMSIARDDMAAKNAPGCACILSQPPAAGPLSKCAAQFCPRTVQSRPVVFVQLDLCLRERASTKPRTNPKKPMTSISRFASLHSLNRAPPTGGLHTLLRHPVATTQEADPQRNFGRALGAFKLLDAKASTCAADFPFLSLVPRCGCTVPLQQRTWGWSG